MSLPASIAALLANPNDARAWGDAAQELEGLGRRSGIVPSHRDEAVSMARLALVALLDDGGLADVEHPVSYFYCIIRNASISLYRRERAEARKIERAQQAADRSPPPPRLSVEEIIGLVRRAAPSAVAVRPRDRRPEIAASIERMIDLAVTGRRTVDVLDEVARQEGLTLVSAEDRARLIDTLDRRHSRARSYLLDAIDRLGRRGDFAPEEAADAREAVGLLRRRQERPARASQG